jgi:glycosyltransferase involved in cell wall biosynthesis
MLSIVIPTHDEEKRILPTLGALTKFLKGRYDYEIIVVDDGSDATAEIVREFAEKNKRVRVIHFSRRIGKGAAVKRGLSAGKGSELLIYDADAATPPDEIPRLVQALKTYDVAVGARHAHDEAGGPFYRRVVRRGFNLLLRALFGWRFRDTQCGFKALRKNAAKVLAREMRRAGYEFDVELLARARRQGFSIVEIPVSWRHVPGGPIERASAFETLAAACRMLAGTVKVRLEV